MGYITQYLSWQGIQIEIRFNATRFNLGYSSNEPMAHLEIRTIDPPRAPLPMTNTGYRSHHAYRNEIMEYGGALEFVQAWLEEAEQSKEWKEFQEEAKQLTLF